MTTTATKENHAEQNAIAWMGEMREMLTKLEQADCRHKDYTTTAALIEPPQSEILMVTTCDECGAILTEDGEPTEELDVDDARETIQQAPLSVQVRGDWYTPGEEPGGPNEFEILLSTGGPALRIVGYLDVHGNPREARLEWQDWGTPWTYHAGHNPEDRATLIGFSSEFYFGDSL
jgi:hypothetical protein